MSEDDAKRPHTRFRRERRANVLGGRQARHVVKVTPEEESELLHRARTARVTVARLMVESALADHGETASDRRETAIELFKAFRLLSVMSININQMAKATNATGEIADEMSVTLAELRNTAMRIRGVLEHFDAS